MNVQLQASSGPASDKPLPRRGKSRDRAQLVAMQSTLFGLVQDSSVAAHIRAQCARAWSDLQERKRVLDGRPLPGQLRPDLEQRRRKAARPQWTMIDALAPHEPPSTTAPCSPTLGSKALSASTAQTDSSTEPTTAAAQISSGQGGESIATASTAKPANSVPCSMCHGSREIRVSGGNRITCRVCRGTGERLDSPGA